MRVFKSIVPYVILAVFFVGFLFSPGASQAKKDTCREKAINEALQMTLLVGADMRAKELHPSWGELQAEVRKRLHVR